MKIVKSGTNVVASNKIKTKSELEKALKDTIDADLCVDIVNLAFSDDGSFSDFVFDSADVFFDLLIDEEPKDVALMFFNGKDLDSRGPANPNRDYFRRDGRDNVESTDDPGAIYYDEILDDIVDFVVKYYDEFEFPDEIQELINEYLDNAED